MLVAGLTKLRSPSATQEALRELGLPARTPLARVLGAAEVCLGALCILLPGRVETAILASAYLTLAATVGLRLLRGERRAPCGCFGDSSAPTNFGHLLLNLICAAVAVAATIQPPPALTTIIGRGLPATALLIGIGCSVYMTVALLTLFPGSWGAYRAGGRDGAL